jgi:putative DNA primase/helicase
VLRGAIRVAPLFLVTAPEPRSGKSHAVKLCVVLATGHDPVATVGSADSTEMDKRIETAALKGQPYLHLNNVENGTVVESAVLSQILTEGKVSIRTLGKHEGPTADCRAMTAYINGNNVSVGADLVLRTVTCRLDAETDRPEEREFDFDPVEMARGARGEYVAAIFTIVRAYMAADCPKAEGAKVVAGFEKWSKFVQHPLMWLGEADPWANIEDARAQDPSREDLERLIAMLIKYAKDLEDEFTTAKCSELAEEHSRDDFGRPIFKRLDLRDLMTVKGKVDVRSFGQLLSRHKDRYSADGWHIKFSRTVHKCAAYCLVAPKGSCPRRSRFSWGVGGYGGLCRPPTRAKRLRIKIVILAFLLGGGGA